MGWFRTCTKFDLHQLEELGYHFRHNRVTNIYTTVTVYYNEEWVGEATFNETGSELKPNEMYASNAWVDAKHQRKGIATAMYVMAEQITGKKIIPTTNQTDDARQLWNDPNKQFGH